MGDPLGSPRVASLLFFFPLKFGLILPVRSANLLFFLLAETRTGEKRRGARAVCDWRRRRKRHNRIWSAGYDGCDHTSTNAPDPIRTPKLSVLGRE